MDDNVRLTVVTVHVMVAIVLILTTHSNHVVKITFLIALSDNEVKNWNDIARIVFELTIKLLVKLVKMVAINF